MDDILGKVNQEVLQERVNSLRNQKEEIRRRLQNPGLYPDQVAPITQQQLAQSYRPAESLQRAALSDLYNMAGRDQSDAYSSSDYAGPREGAGLSSLLAGGLGALAGQVAGRAGAGPLSGLISSMVSGALGKGDPSNKIANSAIKTGLSLAFPQLSPILGLMSLFGISPNFRQGLGELFGIDNVTPGYEGGFFGTQGIGSGLDASQGGFGYGTGIDTTPAGYDSSDLGSGIGTTGMGLDTSQGGLQGAMSDTFGSTSYSGSGLGSDSDSDSGDY